MLKMKLDTAIKMMENVSSCSESMALVIKHWKKQGRGKHIRATNALWDDIVAADYTTDVFDDYPERVIVAFLDYLSARPEKMPSLRLARLLRFRQPTVLLESLSTMMLDGKRFQVDIETGELIDYLALPEECLEMLHRVTKWFSPECTKEMDVIMSGYRRVTELIELYPVTPGTPLMGLLDCLRTLQAQTGKIDSEVDELFFDQRVRHIHSLIRRSEEPVSELIKSLPRTIETVTLLGSIYRPDGLACNGWWDLLSEQDMDSVPENLYASGGRTDWGSMFYRPSEDSTSDVQLVVDYSKMDPLGYEAGNHKLSSMSREQAIAHITACTGTAPEIINIAEYPVRDLSTIQNTVRLFVFEPSHPAFGNMSDMVELEAQDDVWNFFMAVHNRGYATTTSMTLGELKIRRRDVIESLTPRISNSYPSQYSHLNVIRATHDYRDAQ